MSTRSPAAVDQTHRFSGLAERYAARRPDYPRRIFDVLKEKLRTGDTSALALDVGCGTGISTRALAAALVDWSVIGIEPNADMLAQATAEIGGLSNLSYQAATAESLPIQDESAGLILVAQALHWFDRPHFYSEAARALAPGGLLAILNNNRQTNDAPALLAVEEALENANPDYNRDYRAFDILGEIAKSARYRAIGQHDEAWSWPMPTDAFVGYFMSRSSIKPIIADKGIEETVNWLTGISQPFARNGKIDVPMTTTLTYAERI